MHLIAAFQKRFIRGTIPLRGRRVGSPFVVGLALTIALIGLLTAPGAAPGLHAQADANTVQVSLEEWAIEMPNTLPAGRTTFEVTNNGIVAHNFEIEGQGIEEEFEENLQPGETRTMEIDLAPGEYEVYCPIGNHADRGMWLTLTVTETVAEAGNDTEIDETEGVTNTQDFTRTAGQALTTEITSTEEVTSTASTLTGTAEVTSTDALTPGASPPAGLLVLTPQGRTITQEEFDHRFLRAIRQIAAQRGLPLTEDTIGMFAQLHSHFLEQLAIQESLLAEADAREIEPTSEELDAAFDQLRGIYASEQAFRRAMREGGFAEEQALRQYLRDQLRIRQLFNEMRQVIEISDEEIEQFYQENEQLFATESGLVPLELARERIRQALESQQLQEQLMQLRIKHNVETFPGNLAPFEDFAMKQEESAIAPHITVYDQPLTVTGVLSDTGVVFVAVVVSDGPAWIAVHADENGEPGAVLGRTAIQGGWNSDVPIAFDNAEQATETLYAVLHRDAGEAGVFDFPGPDEPVLENGQIVASPFRILDTPGMTGAAGMTGTATMTDTEGITATQEITGAEMMTTTAAVTFTEEMTAAEVLEAMPTVSPTSSVTGTGVTTDTAAGNEAGNADAGNNVIQVSLAEYVIEMPTTLPSGPTSFVVVNYGTEEHNFGIVGPGLEETFDENLQPGDSRTMEIDLAPGPYLVYSPIEDYAQRGMAGVIMVFGE